MVITLIAAMPQKAALLAQQLIAQQVNVAGLQETRNSQSGVFKHDGVYRLVAQCTKQGTHGCEIWINLTVPLANIAGRPFFVDPNKITVVESEPTKAICTDRTPRTHDNGGQCSCTPIRTRPSIS